MNILAKSFFFSSRSLADEKGGWRKKGEQLEAECGLRRSEVHHKYLFSSTLSHSESIK